MKSTIKIMGDFEPMKEYHKSLCLVFESEAFYEDCIKNRAKFKKFLVREYEKYPELFPKDFKEGWKLNGFTEVSKKNGCDNEKDRGRLWCLPSEAIICNALHDRENG